MDKKGQANVINVWGLANIGCTMENPTFQTLVQGSDVQSAEKPADAEERPADAVQPQEAPVVQESFAERVKAIMRKAATKNGQRIETTAKGHASAYVYYIDAEAFCKAMDEMVDAYGQKLKDFLGGSMNCLQVTKVCFFIGHVIRMNVINDTSQ